MATPIDQQQWCEASSASRPGLHGLVPFPGLSGLCCGPDGTARSGRVTEWDARVYNRVSALQRWLAEKSLASLTLEGGERVLDVGCGVGTITAEIAQRVPRGSVLGLDASHTM